MSRPGDVGPHGDELLADADGDWSPDQRDLC